MAGTSGTSILQKPGIMPGFRIFAQAPRAFPQHRGRTAPWDGGLSSWNLSRCLRLIQAGHQGELM
jgi:hypothetical protein